MPSNIRFDEYLVEDPEKMKEGMEMIFSSLKDYYKKLDEDEVREVLIDVVKNGKDLKRAKEKYFGDDLPDSLKSMSLRSPNSIDS